MLVPEVPSALAGLVAPSTTIWRAEASSVAAAFCVAAEVVGVTLCSPQTPQGAAALDGVGAGRGLMSAKSGELEVCEQYRRQ